MSHPVSPYFNLDNRIAVVTGGASGIGTAISRLLAEAGASVIIADINGEQAEQQAARLREAGHSASAIALDLGDESAIVSACADILARHGTPWVLVNNAGLQDRQTFLQGTADEWDRMNRINARGPYLLSREIARAMVAAGEGGRIVNIASAVLEGSIIKGLVSYAGSKGALLGLGKALAFELAEHGITVNTVLPGAVATPGSINARGPAAEGPARRQLPLGMCDGEDIAGAVLYFASPLGRKVTNQVLTVDGGFSVT